MQDNKCPPSDHTTARSLNAIARITGGCSALLGAVVLLGWHAHSSTLVQVLPTLAPMQYNTALSFWLAGCGLLAWAGGRVRLGGMCGIVVALIGMLTLSQYMFGIDLGIDQLLMQHDIIIKTSHPGRMAPNTALSFFLMGIALVMLAKSTSRLLTRLLPGLMGSMVCTFGLVACLGYLTGLETAYGWKPYTDMALHTAVGFVVFGAGIAAYVWRRQRVYSAEGVLLIPALVGVGATTIVLCLWQALLVYEHGLIERTVALAASNIQAGITTQMAVRVQELVRTAKRWEWRVQPSRDVWETDVALYMQHDPHMQAMAWVDASLHLRWIEPLANHEALQGQAVALTPQQQQALELARQSRTVTLTHALDLVSPGKGLQIVVPLFVGEAFHGFLVGIVRPQALLDAVSASFAGDFALVVVDGDDVIYARDQTTQRDRDPWQREIIMHLPRITWHGYIWPTARLLRNKLSILPTIILVMGLSTALMLAALSYFAQLTQRRASQLAANTATLQEEIHARERAEAAVSTQLERLEAVRAVGVELTRELDTSVLLHLLIRSATALVPAGGSGAVYLWDETTKMLQPAVWYNRGAWMQEVLFPLGKGLVGMVAQRREGLVVNDYQDSPYAKVAAAEHSGSTAVMAEPLVYRDQLVGVISLDNHETALSFSPDDVKLFSLFANQATVAIQNARLFTTNQQQMTLLMQTNQALQSEVAERKQAEEALQMSSLLLQSTLDALSANVAILDEAGSIDVVNAAWHRFADANGYSEPSHGLGMNYLALCAAVTGSEAAGAREVAAGIRAVLARQREVFSYEYSCHSPTEQCWYLMCVTRFEAQDGVRAVVVHENITEIKQAEATLRRQQETLYQSEKLAAMSGLVASVAHELNNPLAVLMVHADLLREEITDPALVELVADINQAAERCVRIVRNFLLMARQAPVERTQVQLNTVVTEALQLFAYALRLDDIEVSQHLAEDLPTLWADAHQLHQVIVNLLTNAHQALREASTPRRLTLATRFEPVRQQVVLEVADTGPGIPPAVQTRIFEPFFTTKPPGVGTGLGLSLCHNILAEHGGTLAVESQVGAGAVFRMMLPVNATSPATLDVAEIETPLPPVAGKDLLVIDDEAGAARALVALFRRDGHRVDTATNGLQALEKLQERSYDLILCDLRMPRLDGPSLYRELEQTHPHLLARFIFLTGDTLSPEVKEFLDASGAPYLSKPFRAAEIRRVVRQML